MELLQTICYLTDPCDSIERLISILHFLVKMKLRMQTETNTYRTWSTVIAVNDFGIEPQRLLLLRRLCPAQKLKDVSN